MARGGNPRGVNPTQRAQDAKGALKRLLRELRPYRRLIVLEFLLVVVGRILGVAVPALLGFATDAILSANVERLVQLLVAALAAASISAVFMYVSGRVNRIIVQNFGYRLRREAHDKINRLDIAKLEDESTGDLVSRTTNDADNVVQTLLQVIGQALDSIISVVATVVMMFWISPWLALISLLILPVVGAGSGVLMKKSQPFFRRQWEVTGEVSTLVEESFSGQEILASHGLSPVYMEKFRQRNQELTETSFTAQFLSMLMRPMLTLVSNLSYVVIAVVGALFILEGFMTIGGVQAFIQYSRNFAQPLANIAQIVAMMQSALASSERLFSLLDKPDSPIETDVVPSPDSSSVSTLKPDDAPASSEKAGVALAQGVIRFEDVSFSYIEGKPVIKHFSLTVQKGESVAIVGPTGAGKTTLVNLLERYVDPDSGRITIDGVDIRRIPIEVLRAQIGMVAQDPWLIDDTIEANIAFGAASPRSEDIARAAKESNLDLLVKALPDGYNTAINNDSGTLSAGEKQLLTIARAFYAERPILILDEATSAVDTRTELLLAKAMAGLGRGRTTFTIAHRLSTIRGADIILVMEEGKLVESGTHEDLLAAKGAYYRLYASQFKSEMP